MAFQRSAGFPARGIGIMLFHPTCGGQESPPSYWKLLTSTAIITCGSSMVVISCINVGFKTTLQQETILRIPVNGNAHPFFKTGFQTFVSLGLKSMRINWNEIYIITK